MFVREARIVGKAVAGATKRGQATLQRKGANNPGIPTLQVHSNYSKTIYLF